MDSTNTIRNAKIALATASLVALTGCCNERFDNSRHVYTGKIGSVVIMTGYHTNNVLVTPNPRDEAVPCYVFQHETRIFAMKTAARLMDASKSGETVKLTYSGKPKNTRIPFDDVGVAGCAYFTWAEFPKER